MSLLTTLDRRFAESTVGRWYAGRDAQERPIIAGVAALMAIAIVWLGIWKPISDWRNVETNRLANASATWEWMQVNEASARARARQGAASTGSQRSLMPVITRVANAEGLRLNRLQPEGDGAVSVVVQAQPFNTLLTWLDVLQRSHDVTIQRISIDSEGTPGLVNANLRLL